MPDQPSDSSAAGSNAGRPDAAASAVDHRRRQLRQDMMRSVITEPLLSELQGAAPEKTFNVIVALNELYRGGLPSAMKQVRQRAEEWNVPYDLVSHYVFACLSKERLLQLAQETQEQLKGGPREPVIYRIWQDSETAVTLTHSIATIKADAAQRAFQARGEGICWAVLDSGIDGQHPHFKAAHSPFGPLDTLHVSDPVCHRDFTPAGRALRKAADDDPVDDESAITDGFGHGSHVAGIIAGYWQAEDAVNGDPVAGTEILDERAPDLSVSGGGVLHLEKLQSISGVAPQARLVSMKVIADVDRDDTIQQSAGRGRVSWILLALDRIQQWNQYGKRLLVHGVNMSLGYDFDPRWFACGQSPLCVEVNRLVRSGVVVVVSAGNGGYSTFVLSSMQTQTQYNAQSITDPGNAELAITVGSTHRDMPHTYGVSYFSSRGPTGDGRQKPDLLAPGERIISCAAGLEAAKYAALTTPDGKPAKVLYCEQTGTSMAAPHVSGAVAAFLSVRGEFRGDPQRVKELLLSTAIDLQRERTFQGAGLLDLMKLLQAV